MRRVRACAAIAAWISHTLLLSACSPFEESTPPAAPPAPPQRVTAQPPGPLYPPPPAEARAEIIQWFTAAGYQGYQVRALLEHARLESGFRPCAVGPGDLRYTYQWGGRRLQQLQQFAHTQGCPQLRTQLAFADHELRSEPRFWCFWQATSEGAAYAALRRGFGGGSC
jgi:hypothetical protein